MRAASRLLALTVFAACSDTLDFATNFPAVALDPGQFGFAITARDWTYDQTYSPALASGTLQVGMGVVYSDGTGSVTITDADNVVIFDQTLATNVASGTNVLVSGKAPFSVRVVASDYTGVISIGVNGTPP
jgi:hypothetical protein